MDAPATAHARVVTSAFEFVTTGDVDFDLSGLLASEIHIEGLQAIEVDGQRYTSVEAVDMHASAGGPPGALPALRPVNLAPGTRISVAITDAHEVRVIVFDEKGEHSPLAIASRGAVEARLITADGRAARLNVPTSGVVSMLRNTAPLDLLFTPIKSTSCIVCLPLRVVKPRFERDDMISSPVGPSFRKTSGIAAGGEVRFSGLEAKKIEYGTPLFIDGSSIVLRRLELEQPATQLVAELEVAAAKILAGDAGTELSLVPSYLVYYHSGPPAILLALIFASGAFFVKAWEKYT
jgi:hypothetical protein